MDEPVFDLPARIGRVIADQRAARGWSLGELGRASGLSKTILGKLERGGSNPSIDTLWRVSRALGVPLSELLAEDDGPRVRAVPARSGRHLTAGSGMEAWLVHAEGREHRSELYELDFPAGAEQRTAGHLAGTHEVVLCLEGTLRCGPIGAEVDLGPGDAVWFAADVEHQYVAVAASRALNLVTYVGASR